MAVTKCSECETELMGRIDKKFCNDQCRNIYNNRENRDSNEYVRKVNTILRKNRRILEKLNPNEKSKTTKEELLLEGRITRFFIKEVISIKLLCYNLSIVLKC